MPYGNGHPDANGIWIYGEDDIDALASDMLNRLALSVSAKIADLAAQTKDPGWVNVTLASGVTMQGTDLPKVRKVGNRVQLWWGVNGAGFTANSTKIAFILPVGFRPPRSQYVVVVSNSAATIGTGEIRPNGEVAIRPGGTVGSYYMFDGMSFFVDA